MSIIRTENLEKTYQDNGVPVKALRSVSMTIEPGEFTVIAGPSGSGKTTLLNLIGALDVPTAGTVMLENAVLAELSRDQLSDLRLRNMLVGIVIGHFTLEEWEVFAPQEQELTKRIAHLLVQRLCDQVERLVG